MEQVAIKKLKNPVVDYFCTFLAKFLYSIITCTELYYFSAFLTDTAMFSLAIIGTIQLATTIIDSIFSLFYGVLMTKLGQFLPWGETRSWLLIAPPTVTVTFLFAFLRVSENEMVSAVIIILGFVISHVLWSIGECSMNAQCGLMTEDTNQRAQMSMNLGRGTLASSLVFGYVAGFFLAKFAASPYKYVYMIIIFGVLYWIGYITLFVRSKGCEPTKEEYRIMREQQKKIAGLSDRSISMFGAYRYVFTCKNGLMILLSILTSYLSMFLVSGLMFYYWNYVLIDTPMAMGTFMSLRGLIGLLGGLFWVPILLKICRNRKSVTMVVSALITTVMGLITFFVAKTSGMGYVVIGCIQTFLTGGITMFQVGILTDVGAELTNKTGKDIGTYTVSFLMLPLKVSLILRSTLITAAIGMTGYVAGMEITAKQINGFAQAYLIWPSIIAVLMVIFMSIYKLPESKVMKLVEENAAAKAADDAKIAAALAAEKE